jgi:class 3 adenylate cyclase
MELEARTIMSADIAGFDGLMAGDRRAATRLWNDAWLILEDRMERHGGNRLNLVTPEYMASFPGALDAFSCAVMSQREFSQECESGPVRRKSLLRIGLRHDDYQSLGTYPPVDKLRADADPGGICLSRPVFEEIKSQIEKSREAKEGHKNTVILHQELRRIFDALETTKSPVVKIDAPVLLGETDDPLVASARLKDSNSDIQETK